jgi:hypothetical protein
MQTLEVIFTKEKKTVPTFDLGKPKRVILEALSVFHCLTAEQLTRYLYRSSSHAYVQRHLRELVKANHLQTIVPPKQIRYGTVPFVYALTTRARNYLIGSGIPVKARFWPSDDVRRRGGPLLHTLAVNEVLLKAKLLQEDAPGLALEGFVHERDFARNPLKVEMSEDGQEKTVSLSPDLWLAIKAGNYEFSFCVEVNLTPVEQKRWRRRVRAYLHCLPSYKKRFGTEVITVPTVIESSVNFPKTQRNVQTPEEIHMRDTEALLREKRLTDLVRWTEAELEALNATHAADMFPFSSVSLLDMSPREFFTSSHWIIPFDRSPRALLFTGEGASFG